MNEQINKKIINSFRGEYFFLSNFYEAPVTYNGITYQNNEAAFQAQKCLTKEEKMKFSKLNPSEAKHLGRRVILRKDWESVKIFFMKEIVQAKFEQNPDLMKKLIATEEYYLEEGNTWGDKIWGVQLPVEVGYTPTETECRVVHGQGQNLLGKILMEVRDKELEKVAINQDMIIDRK